MSDNITLPREVVELLRRQHEENEKLQEELAEANAALRTALAAEQTKPEPVGVMQKSYIMEGLVIPVVTQELPVGTPLYAALVTAETGKEIAALREENEQLREALAKCVDAARDCALQHRIAADSMYDQAEAALRRENNHG